MFSIENASRSVRADEADSFFVETDLKFGRVDWGFSPELIILTAMGQINYERPPLQAAETANITGVISRIR